MLLPWSTQGNLMGVINLYDVRGWARFPHSVKLKKERKREEENIN